MESKVHDILSDLNDNLAKAQEMIGSINKRDDINSLVSFINSNILPTTLLLEFLSGEGNDEP